MTALDTNIIVRFVTRDHEEQYQNVYALIEANVCYVPLTVMLETVWVLSIYEYSSCDVARGMCKVLGLPQVEVGQP